MLLLGTPVLEMHACVAVYTSTLAASIHVYTCTMYMQMCVFVCCRCGSNGESMHAQSF